MSTDQNYFSPKWLLKKKDKKQKKISQKYNATIIQNNVSRQGQ